jgi:hypothetical protein
MARIAAGTFMERRFGASAAAVSAALVNAGKEAHIRSLDAKDGSRLKSNHPYGSTFWLALPDEVVTRLLPLLEDAVPFPPQGAQYELLFWEDLAILPVKVIDGGAREGRMRARMSKLRSRLTSVNLPAKPEASLFDNIEGFRVEDFERAALANVERARKAMGDKTAAMIIAAFACNPKSGLQTVEVGIGTFDDRGFIRFTDSERLSILNAPAAATKPVPVAGDSFTDAPRPKPMLGLVEEDTTATGEDEGHYDGPSSR